MYLNDFGYLLVNVLHYSYYLSQSFTLMDDAWSMRFVDDIAMKYYKY